MKVKYIISTAYTICIAATISSCTDLSETVYSNIPMDNFFQNETELLMNAGRAYTKLQEFPMEQSLWSLGTIASDECVVPARHDGEWADQGRWDQIQTHAVKPDNKINRLAWEYVFGGISACNEVLYETESSIIKFPAKDKIIAEIKVLRALFYYWGMDYWGAIPFTIDFNNKDLPLKKSRKEVYKFILDELNNNIDLLDDKATSTSYGRATKGLAYTLLAKMYLNAEVWTGTPQWQKAEEMCDKVIALNQYKLSSDYSDNFKIKNETSQETIFAIVYSSILTTECLYWYDLTLNVLSKYTYNINDSPWDGFMCQPDFFKRYADNDLRKSKTWLYGIQHDFNGKPIMAKNGGSNKPDIMQPFSYNPDFAENKSRADWDGARCCKYEYQTNGLSYDVVDMENDFILFRYADIILMKVEAMMRQNRTTEAVKLTDFQKLRTRVGLMPYTANELTLDELLNERGREFAWEGHRRQDLIRFKKWDDKWFNKPVSHGAQLVFPIPQTAIDTNPNLQ